MKNLGGRRQEDYRDHLQEEMNLNMLTIELNQLTLHKSGGKRGYAAFYFFVYQQLEQCAQYTLNKPSPSETFNRLWKQLCQHRFYHSLPNFYCLPPLYSATSADEMQRIKAAMQAIIDVFKLRRCNYHVVKQNAGRLGVFRLLDELKVLKKEVFVLDGTSPIVIRDDVDRLITWLSGGDSPKEPIEKLKKIRDGMIADNQSPSHMPLAFDMDQRYFSPYYVSYCTLIQEGGSVHSCLSLLDSIAPYHRHSTKGGASTVVKNLGKCLEEMKKYAIQPLVDLLQDAEALEGKLDAVLSEEQQQFVLSSDSSSEAQKLDPHAIAQEVIRAALQIKKKFLQRVKLLTHNPDALSFAAAYADREEPRSDSLRGASVRF